MILDYWGKPLSGAPESIYRPNKVTKERTQEVLKDFEHALTIRQKSYPEFNDRTLLDYQSASQRAFNGYQGPSSSDPDEAWKQDVKRPITRNRIISIAAHVTGAVIYPTVFAQNSRDEEEKDASIVMRDLVEWSGDNSTPGYVRTFLYSVIAALVNPAVILHTEYCEIYRKIKIMKEEGWEEKRVLDEIMSGFQDAIVPVDELYIADFYVHAIQKQPFLVWRRVLDYNQAKAKYGEHKNWKYVKAGIQTIFDTDADGWYDQKDDKLSDRQVEEFIYHRRHDDLCLYYVNGILLCDVDQPNPRQDKKYPFAKSGYELIDEGTFFYYRSLADKMSSDQEVIDLLYELIINGTIMDQIPPIAHYGDEEIDAGVMVSGVVTSFAKDAKIEAIRTGGNLGATMATLEKVEASASESSQDQLQSGSSPGGDQTAFEIGRLEANARVMLGLFAKMIGFLVQEYGYLRISDILQYMTLADIHEISDENSAVKFSSFLLPDKQVEGKTKTRKIEFTYDGQEQDPRDQAYDLMDREEDSEDAPEIMKVNPELFRKLKFMIRVVPEPKAQMSDALEKALNLEAYDRAINDPNADQKAIYKKLLLGSYEATKGNVDEFVREDQPMQPTGIDPSQQLTQQITGAQPSLGKLIGA